MRNFLFGTVVPVCMLAVVLLITLSGCASTFPAPTTAETRTVLGCLSKVTAMPWDTQQLPKEVVVSERTDLGQPLPVTLDTGQHIGGNGYVVVAQYFPVTRRVLLSATWTWPTYAHELFHFLQSTLPLKEQPKTRDETESQAYRAEAVYSRRCLSAIGQPLTEPKGR